MQPGTRRAAALALLIVAAASDASADETDTCLAAHVAGQRLRLAGRLRAAREELIACAQASCPSVLREECSQWLGEVERSLPTMVLSARGGDGRETTAVRVRIDDGAESASLPASAIAVDPGEHVVRFTDARGTVVTQRVIVREGEKNKLVSVRFAPPPAPAPAPAVAPERAGLPPAFFVASAIGVVGVAAFATLGILGKNEQSQIEDGGCKPSCTRDQVMPMYRLYVAADVSLAVGAVAAGIAGYFGVRHLVVEPAANPAVSR